MLFFKNILFIKSDGSGDLGGTGHLAGDGAAGVVENIGDCIPRYTILSAMKFLYEADVFMVMIYILIFLGKLISNIILDMQKCVREA